MATWYPPPTLQVAIFFLALWANTVFLKYKEMKSQWNESVCHFHRHFVFVIASLFLSFFDAYGLNSFHVIIDAGHGGQDQGATFKELKEAQLTLRMAEKLKNRLERENYKVTLTRETNNHLALKKRIQLATQAKADLFISLHMNASLNPEVEGFEIYYQNQLPADEEALFLAHQEEALADDEALVLPDDSHPQGASNLPAEVKAILFDVQKNQNIYQSARLAGNLYNSWRGKKKKSHLSLRQAPFYVLKMHQTPSVLIELGYLTNEREALQLQSASYQNQMIDDLARGIRKYKETGDKPENSSLWFSDAKSPAPPKRSPSAHN